MRLILETWWYFGEMLISEYTRHGTKTSVKPFHRWCYPPRAMAIHMPFAEYSGSFYQGQCQHEPGIDSTKMRFGNCQPESTVQSACMHGCLLRGHFPQLLWSTANFLKLSIIMRKCRSNCLHYIYVLWIVMGQIWQVNLVFIQVFVKDFEE